MKKIISFALVALMAGMLFSSCHKTDEEKYIADVKDYFDEREALNELELDELETLVEMKTACGKDAIEAFQNVDWTGKEPITKEDFEDTKLKFTSDQIKELNEIRKKFRALDKEYKKKRDELYDRGSNDEDDDD